MVLHLGLRVKVMDDEYLRHSLDQASWVDTNSTFLDVLGLGGMEAVVVCDKEAKTLGRVGIRTDDGYEDAVPLSGLLPIEEKKEKGRCHRSTRPQYAMTPWLIEQSVVVECRWQNP